METPRTLDITIQNILVLIEFEFFRVLIIKLIKFFMKIKKFYYEINKAFD